MLALFSRLPQSCMAAPTKNQKIEALVKLVQRRCRGQGITQPLQRTVLETLMYAALLENASFEKADIAYTVLENYYIDWNEIRVCSVRELADTLIDLPSPDAAAERIRKALQGIFEKTYMFELEDMRKKGKALAEHIKTLEAMSAGTPYMIQYTAQIALDGHVIPLDEASLRIMRRLGLSQVSSDGTQEICLGLDRVVLKKAGLTFAAQLHHFAAGYYDVPDSPELLSFLSTIDRAAVDRSWMPPVLAAKSAASAAVPPADSNSVPPSVSKTKSESSKIDMPKTKKPSTKNPATKADSKPASKDKIEKKSTSGKSTSGKSAKASVGAKQPSGQKGASGASSVKASNGPLKDATVKKPVKKSALPQRVKPVPPSRKAIVKSAPVKKVPVKKAPVKKVPVKKAPVKKSSAESVKKAKIQSPSKTLRKKKPK